MVVKAKRVFVAALLFVLICSLSESSFSSTGVPCYLHPSADGCHYRLRPDSANCSTAAQREHLSKRIAVVNRTLAALEHQLIRLGVIPPDNSCSKLPAVENGGIIYDDLNLAPGAVGRYTCYDGYTLISMDGSGRYEYKCTEDGIWDGDVITVPVKCQLSSGRCDNVAEIENGTVVYVNNDSSNTLIGDMVAYSCLAGYEMNGAPERFCLRTGNWSGEEPQCVQSQSPSKEGQLVSGIRKRLGLILGSTIGSAVALAILATLVIVAVVLVCRRKKSKSKLYQRFESRRNEDTNGDRYESFGDRKENHDEDTAQGAFDDSFENTIDPLEDGTSDMPTNQDKPRSSSAWRPSLQLIKETAIAAAARGKERLSVSGNHSKRSSRIVVVKDDDEASL